MENMSKEEFMRQSEAAVRRMREMSEHTSFKGAPHKMPPTPSFVKMNGNIEKEPTAPIKHEQSINIHSKKDGFSLPFLDMFKNDKDMPIILGLLLLLMSEKGDKRLLFALLYILM